MDSILSLISWVQEHSTVILGVLLALSEALALIPAIKANSVFQLLFGWLQKNKPAEQK